MSGARGAATTPETPEEPAAWRGVLLKQLHERNRLQRDVFRDSFEAYNEVLKVAKREQSRVLELEKQLVTLRENPLVRTSRASLADETNVAPEHANRQSTPRSTSVFDMSPFSSSNAPTADSIPTNAQISDYEERIRILQEDLIKAYRLQKENDDVIVRLKERATSDEKLMMQKTDALADLKKDMSKVENERELDKEELTHAKETGELLRKEVSSLRAQLSEMDKKIADLTRENRELIERVKAAKQELADWINQNDSDSRPSLLDEVDEIKESDLADILNDSSSWGAMGFGVVVPTKPARRIEAHRDQVSSVAFSMNGIAIVSGGADGIVKQWRCDSGEMVNDFRGAKQAVMSVNFSPDMSMVVGAGNDRTARIWAIRTCRNINTLTGHTNKIYAAVFNNTSSKVITGSFDRTIRVWDVASGYSKRTIMCISSCNNLSLSPDGIAIASAHLDGHVRMWSMETGKSIRDITGIHRSQVTSTCFSMSGGVLASNSKDNTIQLIDMRTFEPIRTLSHDNYRVNVNWSRAVFSPDGRYVASGAANGSIFIWNADSGKLDSELKGHTTSVTSLDWNRIGNSVVSSDKSGEVILWH